MPKSKDKFKLPPEDLEKVPEITSTEWEMMDDQDEAFWDEFFKIEELLEVTDELDPPQFTINVMNHRTGEVKTFSRVRLKSTKNSIEC